MNIIEAKRNEEFVSTKHKSFVLSVRLSGVTGCEREFKIQKKVAVEEIFEPFSEDNLPRTT